MKYRVIERTTYERCFIIEADDPEEAKEICEEQAYESEKPAEYAGNEYKIVGAVED